MLLSQPQILYGSNKELPEQIELRAGILSALFEGGTIRHIKLGDTLVLHQIYAAVRDHNWNTTPAELHDLHIDTHDDSFKISFTSHHQQDHIDFVWNGTISGESSGTIRFEFDGVANSTFDRNRIGFCVLHPTNCAGVPCRVEHTDDSVTAGEFPQFISPHQPFFDIRAITHHVQGMDVRVLMEGDTFEMEDQRNWTDASYKTYCTPLGLPFPVTINAGDTVKQTITLSLDGEPASKNVGGESSLRISVDDHQLGCIPEIGLGIAEKPKSLTDDQVNRLRQLNLNHLRADIHLYRDAWKDTLHQANQQSKQLDAKLEIAVHLSNNADDELQQLAQVLDSQELSVSRWIIFHQDEKSTSAKWVNLAKNYLKTVPVGGGTNAFFTELNRERPPVDAIDFAVYSTNSQVHAFDNLSLVETLALQADNATSARQFCGDKPIAVSPITFRMRFNPNATGDAPPVPEGELPPQVDERQMSLFGACWTLGSLKYNIESQVESITYYETVGWRGVMEGAGEPAISDKFPSIANAVFPMYHVFADIGELENATVIRSQSSDALLVDVLAFDHNGNKSIFIANMSPHEQTIQLNIPEGTYAVRRLNANNGLDAMTKPNRYRESASESLTIDGVGSLTMFAYEYIRLQQEQA